VSGDLWVSTGLVKYYNGSSTLSFATSNADSAFSTTQSFSPASGTGVSVTQAASSVGLSVTTSASTPGNAMQVLASDGSTVRAQISAAGALTVSPSSGTAATINAAASSVGLVVKYSGTGTANLQDWQNSGGTAIVSVGYDGSMIWNSSIGGPTIRWGSQNVMQSSVAPNTMVLFPYSNLRYGLSVRALSGQTADLQQWQDSAAATLGGRNAAGQTYAGSTAAAVGSTTTALTSAAYTSTTVAVFTYGGTSLVQTGQTVTVAGVSGGAYNGTWVVSAVTSTTFTVLGSGFTNNAGTGGTFKLSAVGSFTAGTAAITPVVVKAAAFQSANIQEWQDSTGALVASLDSSGISRSASVRTNSNSVKLDETAAGGTMSLLRCTSLPASPGANNARLYFRDGTTAGTLKLVVRAGSAGAETTILDNIPQT
jgi:hypothetical protein